MNFQNFELEHYQSRYERTVEYNLADSSVQCLQTREWLSPEEAGQLLDTSLYYPEVNGTRRLRERIASLYPGATAENVLVTVGAAQANLTICATLLEPGDEVIVVTPGYRQVWGLAKNAGCLVREVHLRAEDDWRLDVDELRRLASRKTRFISIVNPNNPTGTVLDREQMRAIIGVCEQSGAWLHADEVYCGTEFSGQETPSFWGSYDKTICVNSLSKAYGLAGTRIGWAVAPLETIEALWRRHEYFVIAAAAPSMTLAEIALRTDKRQSLFERQRQLSLQGKALLSDWLKQQNGLLSVAKSDATAIAFVRYHLDLPSLEVAEHIRKKASVLVAPGAQLGTEGHLRMSVGYDLKKVKAALDRIGEAVAELAPALSHSTRA